MTVEFVNLNTFQKRLDAKKKIAKEKVFVSLQRSADEVRNHAVKSILRGNPTGVLYKKYRPRRDHRASAEDQPPASDTGFLASNISATVKKSPLVMVGEVRSAAKYSKHLEYGTATMGKRPFMRPALIKSRKKILQIFRTNGLIS